MLLTAPRADFKGSMKPLCLLVITSMANAFKHPYMLVCLNAKLSQPFILHI